MDMYSHTFPMTKIQGEFKLESNLNGSKMIIVKVAPHIEMETKAFYSF